MRCDRERDRVRRRPRSPGLKELMRRRVLRAEASDARESRDTERFLRLVSALSSACFLRRGGERDRDGERLVEMVDTESAEDVESERERLR
jgi:predicted secreted protein